MAHVAVFSPRGTHFTGGAGHSVTIAAGQTQEIHESLLDLALARGCLPADLLAKSEVVRQAPPRPEDISGPTSEERVLAIREAIELVMGDPDDSKRSNAGRPKAREVTKLLKFRPEAGEVDALYDTLFAAD